MKNTADGIQILLRDNSMLGFFAWVLFCAVFFQSARIFFASFKLAWRGLAWAWKRRYFVLLPVNTIAFWLWFSTASILCWAFRDPLVERLQYLEQVYLFPVYLNPDTSCSVTDVYERELRRHVSQSEFEIVQRATRETAAMVGSTPLSIYEVAYSECRLDPFAANVDKRTGDTIAFGWIQFTPAGLSGIQHGGKPLTMRTVKGWAKSRNVAAMMQASQDYLVLRSKGKPLARPVDVYVCVFAPGFVGAPGTTVLYSISGWREAYIKNQVFDGYALVGDKIVRAQRFKDGKITVQDLMLHLFLKKSIFLGKKGM